MRRQPLLCPVHVYERVCCDAKCSLARLKLRVLENDYRQYWYDRARGVGVMPAARFNHVRSRPVWQVWRSAEKNDPIESSIGS